MRSDITPRVALLALLVSLSALLVGFRGPRQERSEPADPGVASSGGAVGHMRIAGALDLGTLALLQRALGEVRASGGDRLVIEIDTPGGPVDIMWLMAKAIDEAVRDGVLVVAWVNDRALSAGVLVSLACERVYMRQRATIGSAQPVITLPGGIAPLPEAGGLREKWTSSLRAQFRACAEWRGRSPVLAEAMVDEQIEVRLIEVDGESRIVSGKEYDDLQEKNTYVLFRRTLCERGELLNLTANEALEHRFVEGLAESLDEVLEKIGARGASVVRIERARSEDLLGALNQIGFLLVAAGLILAFIELKVPGFGVPGILSVLCFGLLFTGRYMVGLADIPHIVLAAVGIICIAVDIFLLPGTLWLGLAGGGLLLGGLLLGELGPGFSLANPLDRDLGFDAVFRLVMTALGAILGAWFVGRFLPDTPIFRRMVLGADGAASAFGAAVPEVDSAARERVPRVGDHGTALTPLRPVGKVQLEGLEQRDFEARASGDALEAGASVRVTEVSGGRLVVDELEAEA
ncbi:MAG: membrane-bound serine protease (ClpP class) [Planctomycetota bacterium]|jgi:membrane-bound serine protease (ClpP class)